MSTQHGIVKCVYGEHYYDKDKYYHCSACNDPHNVLRSPDLYRCHTCEATGWIQHADESKTWNLKCSVCKGKGCLLEMICEGSK